MEVGSRKLEVVRWKPEVKRWKLEVESRKLEVGSYESEVGSRKTLLGFRRITYQQLRGYLSHRTLTKMFISRKHLEQTQDREINPLLSKVSDTFNPMFLIVWGLSNVTSLHFT